MLARFPAFSSAFSFADVDTYVGTPGRFLPLFHLHAQRYRWNGNIIMSRPYRYNQSDPYYSTIGTALLQWLCGTQWFIMAMACLGHNVIWLGHVGMLHPDYGLLISGSICCWSLWNWNLHYLVDLCVHNLMPVLHIYFSHPESTKIAPHVLFGLPGVCPFYFYPHRTRTNTKRNEGWGGVTCQHNCSMLLLALWGSGWVSNFHKKKFTLGIRTLEWSHNLVPCQAIW